MSGIAGLGGQAPLQHIGQQDQTQRIGNQIGVRVLPQVNNLQNARALGQQQIPNQGAAQLRGQVQESTLGKIGRWFKEGNIRAKGNAGLPPTITIRHPKLGDIRYSNQELKSFINTLPRLDRQAARDNLVQNLYNRIDAGSRLMADVLSGRADNVNPDVPQVSDLMLYIDALAHSKGCAFVEGALNLEDPEGKLYQFLDRCPEKYLRDSSHLKAEQRANVDGHTNVHRGIDIPQGPGGLPNNRRTIMIATIPAKEGAGRQVFIKPETFGCRFNTLKNHERLAGSSASPERNIRFLENPGEFFQNLGEAIQHGLSFLSAQGNKTVEALGDVSTRKERISPAIIDAFNQAKEKLGAYTSAQPERMRALDSMLEILDKNNPTADDKGVHAMIKNFKEAMYQVKNPEFNVPEMQELMASVINDFAMAVAPHLKEVNGLEVRVGDEVIFTRDQMINPENHATVPLGNFMKATKIAAACELTVQDSNRLMYAGGLEALTQSLGKNGATEAQLSGFKDLLMHNAVDGNLTVAQMVDNLKNLYTSVPDGPLKNFASSNIVQTLSYLMPQHTIDGIDSNKDKLKSVLTSIMPNQANWSPAQRDLVAGIDKPEFLLTISNSHTQISTAMLNLINLPPTADENDAIAARQGFYAALRNSLVGTTNSNDSSSTILDTLMKFTLQGMPVAQQNELYAKLSTPEAQTERAYESMLVMAMKRGAVDYGYNDLVGIYGEAAAINEQVITSLEDQLGIQPENRLNSNFNQICNQVIEQSLLDEVQKTFRLTAAIPDINIQTIDGKNVISFDEAMAKGKEILPDTFVVDMDRGTFLKIRERNGQVTTLDSYDQVLNAFKITGSDGKQYLDIELCRAVTSLACQTGLAPTEDILQRDGNLQKGTVLMAQVGIHTISRDFIYDPESMKLTIEQTKPVSYMLFPDSGNLLALADSHYEESIDLTLNQHVDGSFIVNVTDSYIGTHWNPAAPLE